MKYLKSSKANLSNSSCEVHEELMYKRIVLKGSETFKLFDKGFNKVIYPDKDNFFVGEVVLVEIWKSNGGLREKRKAVIVGGSNIYNNFELTISNISKLEREVVNILLTDKVREAI